MITLESSILIPTYNRPKDLKKLIHYVVNNFSLSNVHIFVLDGSDEGHAHVNEQICKNHENIAYQSYGKKQTYVERLLSGIKQVKTNTVTILGDDDIIDPDGLTDCVRFLHENDDYAVAHGKYIAFNYTPDGIKFNETYQSESIENKSALKRLFNFFSSYTAPTYYAVNRTALLKKSFEALLKNDFDIHDYIAAEIMVSAIPVANGKLKRLDSFFQARRFIPAPKDKYVIYAKYIMENDFSEKINKIKISIMENMDLREPVKTQIISDSIDYAFASFFGQRLTRNEIFQRFQNLDIQ